MIIMESADNPSTDRLRIAERIQIPSFFDAFLIFLSVVFSIIKKKCKQTYNCNFVSAVSQLISIKAL